MAAISRRYVRETVRTTVEQNLVLRWVSETDLPHLYDELVALGLAESGAGTIADVTACPGTDTCKLGIASSRGLAAEMRQRLSEENGQLNEAIEALRNQNQRLLQLLRPTSRGRHRLLRQQPQDQRHHRAALSGRLGRPVARKRRLLRLGHGRCAL